ncbi:MAG TPA: helix-turn-helix domain-containing protein [Paraburkholderia sp.]|jgi:transcriptional regulator GlxA family with amidase domain|nr:helix-turn-helix domain-containing protein [Paraburkholderia sp.]
MTYAAAQLTADTPAMPQAVEPAARRIGLVLFERFSLPDVSMVAELFQLANRHGTAGNRPMRYSVRVLSMDGGRVASSSLLQLHTEALDACTRERFDGLFVFGARDDRGVARDERLTRWLSAAAPSARTVVRPLRTAHSIPGTHRGLCAMQQNGDAVKGTMGVQTTSAATATIAATVAIDRDEPARSALAFVARDLGPSVAREIAAELMPDANARLLYAANGADLSVAERIHGCAQWLRRNCERPISVADAAQEAAMSERNFLRRFKTEFGCAPSEYLLQARLDMSCKLLAATELPVDKVARRCGMGNGDNLARMFRKRWSISPTEYRLRHRGETAKPVDGVPQRTPVE